MRGSAGDQPLIIPMIARTASATGCPTVPTVAAMPAMAISARCRSGAGTAASAVAAGTDSSSSAALGLRHLGPQLGHQPPEFDEGRDQRRVLRGRRAALVLDDADIAGAAVHVHVVAVEVAVTAHELIPVFPLPPYMLTLSPK